MTAVFEPPGQQTFLLTKIDVNGQPYTVPNAGGFVYMYEPGSTVPRLTWVDSAQTAANTNPIRLDPDGRCAIFGTGEYRQIVTDATGDVQWDQLTELGIDSTFITSFIVDTPVTVDGPNPNPPLSNPDQGQRPLAAVLGSFVDARNGRFGALRQGGNDLVVIQAAINYAANIGGATVYLGPGPLTTDGTTQLVWPISGSGVTLRGDGPGTTVLTANGTLHQDVLVLTAGSLNACQIRDIGFSAGGTATAGAWIHAANARLFVVENVVISGSFYDGVFIEGGPNQSFSRIRDFTCSGVGNTGIQIGGDTTGAVQSTRISDSVLGESQFGIVLRSVAGVNVSDTQCFSHTNSGVATIPPTGVSVSAIQLTGVICSNCTNAGFYLGDAGGNSYFTAMTNCWSSNNLIGVEIGSNPAENNVSIVGCQIHSNQHEGILNTGANAVLITGCVLAGNGAAAANTYNAIAINGAGIQNVVSGNFVGPAFGIPAMHRYAVTLSGAVDYCTVTGNVTGGGGTGTINNGSTGTHNVIANNTGT